MVLTIPVVLACLLGGCATVDSVTAVGAPADNVIAQASEAAGASLGGESVLSEAQRWHNRQRSVADEAELVFKILSAEMAGRRGRIDIASRNYSDAAGATSDPRVAERAVKLALYNRDLTRADSAVGRWVELDPANIEAWQHRAQISLQQKNVTDTTDALSQVISLSSDSPAEVIPGVVNSILSQSDAETGVEVLAQLADRYPNSADTQYGIGRFAMSRGEREAAMRAFDRALEIDPENIEALLSRARLKAETGDAAEGIAEIASFVEKFPDNIAAQLGFARLLVENGSYEEATDRFEVISGRFAEDADSLFTIGLLALEIKRIKQAETYLLRVVDLDQHTDSAYYYLARIADSRRDYEEAVERYRLVQNGDNFFDAQTRAAELLGLLDRVDEGRELIGELRSYSQEPSVRIELINAESRILNSNDQHNEAYKVLNAGLDKYPDDTALLYARALVAERLDKQEVFERDLLQVISMQPDNAYALNALGYFLADRNLRLDEAEEYLSRAIELLPDDPAVIDSVGWLYYRQQRYSESIEMLRRAHELYPDPEISAHLGEVLWVSGDQANANKVWQEALSEDPDDDLLNAVIEKYQP